MVKDVVNFSLAELNNLLNDSNSCVEVINDVLNIALYPYQLNDFKLSLKAVLNRKIGKYDKRLCGILLSYKNVKVLSELGAIIEDSCFIHIDVKADFYIFKPMVDSTLVGIVNKRSNDHIGCLVHRVFNVSIPKPNNSTDWDTSTIRNGQEILLNISHVDLHATLPYIRAKLLSVLSKPEKVNEQHEPNKKTKKKRLSDPFESTVEQIDKSTEDVTEKKKKKNQNIDESEISHEINNGMPDESVTKKKKHKKNHTDLEYPPENVYKEQRKNSITETNVEEKTTKKKRKSNNSLDENCKLENSLNDSSKYKTKSKKDNSLDIQTEIKSKKRKHSTTESMSEYESSPKKKKKDESDLSKLKKKSKKYNNTL